MRAFMRKLRITSRIPCVTLTLIVSEVRVSGSIARLTVTIIQASLDDRKIEMVLVSRYPYAKRERRSGLLLGSFLRFFPTCPYLEFYFSKNCNVRVSVDWCERSICKPQRDTHAYACLYIFPSIQI